MQEEAPDPTPVPKFEALQWSGERLELDERAQSPRLARLGDDDAVLTYIGADRKLWSRHVRNAFSKWPPDVGDAVSHPHGSINFNPTGLRGWPDGCFSINTSAGWIFAGVNEPGVLCSLPGPGFPDPAGGVFTFSGSAHEARLVYRAKREPQSHVVDFGALPEGVEVGATHVIDRGRLILPAWRADAALRIFVTRDGKIHEGGAIVTPRCRTWAIAKPSGGLLLALDRRETVEIHAVTNEGAVIGQPSIQPNVSSIDHLAAMAPWRDGFALCTTRERTGFAVRVSDGVHTTFGRGAVREDLPIGDFMALTASPDGKVLLFAGPNRSNLVLLRLVCGPGDAATPFIPERIVLAVVPPAQRRSPLQIRETVLLNLRQRKLLAAFASLRDYGAACAFEGDERAGWYSGTNQQGADFAVHWDATGLVALGFSNGSSESEAVLELEDRRPGRYLVGLPKEMRALALRAIAFGSRHATEGFWIAATGSAHGQGGQLEVLEQLGRFDDGEVWLGGGSELSALAGRIAPRDQYTLTGDDERLLLDSATADGGSLEPDRVKEAAEALAKLGVDWPGAAALAQRASQIDAPEIDAPPFVPPPAEVYRRRPPRPPLDEPGEPPAVPAEPLPIVPTLETTGRAKEVSALIERAAEALESDSVAALDALLAAWRLNRDPRLAEIAETLALRTRGSRTSYMARQFGRADAAATLRALQAALDAPPEPTTTRAVLEWLWTAWGSSTPVEDAAAEVLIHARDGRFAESLEQLCALGRPGSSKPVRRSMTVALQALLELVPGPLTKRDIQRVGTIEDAVAGRPRRSKGPATRDLFMAVYENPDDDGPRRDLANRLVEAGDPRGEFISLQLDRDGTHREPTRRETELLATHGRAWMGEIEPILGSQFTYERGFVVSVTTKEGDVGRRTPARAAPILTTGGGTQWEWSTVRRLDLWPHALQRTVGLLRGSRIRGLVEISNMSEPDLGDLVHGPPRRLERLEITHRRAEVSFGLRDEHLDLLPEKLPDLRSLALAAPGGELATLRPMLGRLPKLRELSVRLARPSLDELAAAGRELGLERVTSLGRMNFTHCLGTGTLTLTFPYVFDESYGKRAAEALEHAGPLQCIEVVVPRGARLVPADGGGAPGIERDWDSMSLELVFAAARARGVPCRIEHWTVADA